MNPRVTIILHFTGDFEALEGHLPNLVAEVKARHSGDEVLLVDDSDEDLLTDWIAQRHPSMRVIKKNRREGRAKAYLMGAQAANCEYIFMLAPDKRIRVGALGPLVAAMQGPSILAVTPRIVHGENGAPDLPGALSVEQGRPVVLPSKNGPDENHLHPVPFASGAACLMLRDVFLSRAGFDDLFDAPYWEDVDMGLSGWRQGLRVLEVPQSIVEHHPQADPDLLIPEPIHRAAIERGRLLLYWKHLDKRKDAADHVQALWRDAVDSALSDRKEDLIWLALALDDVEQATEARGNVHPVQRSLADALQAS
ncbi:MAG: glycosyltransferase, partial [Planctomycetes bacterium]|nr:glycosyltransferase [Planctomycetota bacterium]